MQRSQRLGHCICDPRKPCPCKAIQELDVCTCAGERFEKEKPSTDAPLLTKLVKNAGCASKIAPVYLEKVLKRLPRVTDPRLLVGTSTADDAGVFRLSDDLALVQTVDVFSPCVDDPYTFGRVAACNSLSDVYAMGGTPVTALSVIGYPIHTLGDEWMYLMLKGGMDVLEEAGVALVGGHSINDEEIKFGFAITGTIHPDAIITNAGARSEDVLILTEPIGIGVISFAAQMERASAESVRAAEGVMTRLNRSASEIMLDAEATSCTDVTGFGLLGHLYHIVKESGVTAEIWLGAVPTLPGALELLKEGVLSGAAERNREFASRIVQLEDTIDADAADILYDAQTSGGLLFTVSPDKTDEVLTRLRSSGCPRAAIIGRITKRSEGRIMVKNKGTQDTQCCPDSSSSERSHTHSEKCCASDAPPASADSAQEAFQAFMAKALAPGAIDVVQKELMTIALSVAVQCRSCLKIHMEKARKMGLSPEEIEEAAWMGVVFGGCRSMMFWNERTC